MAGKVNVSRCIPLTVAVILLLSFASCSSAPKRPMSVTGAADKAYVFFESGNEGLTKGDLRQAGKDLEKAYNIAVSIDDSSLLCRVSLSAIVYKILKGDIENGESDGPFSSYSCNDLLSMAEDFASRTENALLKDICPVYHARILLSGNPVPVENAEKAVSVIEGKDKIFAKEPFYLGFYYRTMGDALRVLEKYQEAGAMYEKAAEIHLKDRYLYELGVDWYSCAAVRSLAGNKKTALEAVDTALKYDRAAENTFAIASDYEAYARILLKHSPSREDMASALRALKWASEVFASGGFTVQAEECRNAAASVPSM